MMGWCLGNSPHRHSTLWPKLTKTLPTASVSRVCGLGPRAFAFEPQLLAFAKGFRLFPWDSYEQFLLQKFKFAYEHYRAGGDFSFHSNVGVPQIFSSKIGDSRCSSGSNGETFTLTDIAKRSLDLHGWKVLMRDTKEVVGIVDEIIHIGSADSDEIFESVLKLVCTSGSTNEDFEGSQSDAEDGENSEYLEFLVPLVEDIVREVDVENNCLFITPPEGLLELARIPQLLRELEPKLLEFCRQQNDGIKGCINSVRASDNGRFSDDAKQLMSWSGEFKQERFDIFMPTKRQLVAAGRHDLVDDIKAAGGFLAVAQSLNLRSRRRPNGFWEDMKNLDAEIEWFVSSSWTKLKDPETGELFYQNQATGEVSNREPSPGTVSNPAPVSQDSFDEGTAVMPRQRKVLEAGRYDLHHAILRHGGYRLVAQQLGRQPVSKDTKFIVKIKSFMKEHSMSHFPAMKELRACGRRDLAYLLRRQGGVNVVSEMMDIRPRRYGGGQWSDIEVAAAAIRAYICNKLIIERRLNESTMDRSDLEDMVWKDALRAGTLVIPSQTNLLRNNRSDLRYLLQKFGREELSHYMGVKFVPWGKKETHLKW
ncbi:unnamed protein product [Calypogeia fissa]